MSNGAGNIESVKEKDFGEMASDYGSTKQLDMKFYFDSDNSSQFPSSPEFYPTSSGDTEFSLNNSASAIGTNKNSLLQPVNVDLRSAKNVNEKNVETRSIFSPKVQDIKNYPKDSSLGPSRETPSESTQNSSPKRATASNQLLSSGKIGTGSTLHTRGPSLAKNKTENKPTLSISSRKSHDSAEFKYSPLSIESSKPSSIKNYCSGLVHSIERLTPRKYSVFLVDIMRKISNQISLDDFYSLLAGASSNKNTSFDDIHQNEMFWVSGASDAIKICSFIIQKFKRANGEISSNYKDSEKPLALGSLNFNEFSRTFLAIKILFDCIIEEEKDCSTQEGIPRSSVYSVYREMSQKLTGRYKTASDSFKIHRNTAIGISQFGILTKLIYPNLKMRRLGSRGKSSPYYFGITWNYGVVGTEMVLCVESKAPKRFIRSATTSEYKPRDGSSSSETRSGLDIQKHQLKPLQSNLPYSFVDMSTRIPATKFMIRDWNVIPGKRPQKSDWSETVLKSSVMSLKRYKVHMMPLVRNFQQSFLSPMKPNKFHTEFVKKMNILIKGNSDKEGYMNLYLVILLLLFPIILTSNEELLPKAKSQLRENLTLFVSSVSSDVLYLPKSEVNHFINFLNIIRKIINLNKLSSSQVKSDLTKRITQEIASEFLKPVIAEENQLVAVSMKEIIFQAVSVAMNAYRVEFVDTLGENSKNVNLMMKVVQAFGKYFFTCGETLLEISNSLSTQDSDNATFNLPFHLFLKSTQLFHQICLSDPFVKKLPVQVIGFVVFEMNRRFQNFSFSHYARREPELSTNIFKTWWIHSTLEEEYFQILAETIALSQKVEDKRSRENLATRI